MSITVAGPVTRGSELDDAWFARMDAKRQARETLRRLDLAATVAAVSPTAATLAAAARIAPSEAQIVRHYSAGKSLRQVARDLAVSTDVVRRAVERRGALRTSRPATREYPAELVEQVRQLAANGHGQAAISGQTGLGRGVIARVMDRHGIEVTR